MPGFRIEGRGRSLGHCWDLAKSGGSAVVCRRPRCAERRNIGAQRRLLELTGPLTEKNALRAMKSRSATMPAARGGDAAGHALHGRALEARPKRPGF